MNTGTLSCPWALHNLVVNHDGFYMPCCRNINSGQFPKQKDMGIDEAFYHKAFDDLRNSLEKGHFPPACQTCADEENLGLKSLRQKTYKHTHSKKPELMGLELFLGKICNMKCRMCGPDSSSLWAKELGLNHKETRHPLELIKDTDLTSVRLLKLLGGETLINPHLFKVLDHFIDLGLSKKIILLITTNGTRGPQDELLARLKKFQSLQLIFSVDGLGDVAEYIRHGQNWDLIHNNMQMWAREVADNFSFRLHCTLQAGNFHQLADILLYANELNFDFSFRLLEYPNALRLQNLPPALLQKLTEKFRYHPEASIIKNYLKKNNQLKLWDVFSSEIAKLPHGDPVLLINEFEKYDKAWHTDWRTSLPELAEDLDQAINSLSDHGYYESSGESLVAELHSSLPKG